MEGQHKQENIRNISRMSYHRVIGGFWATDDGSSFPVVKREMFLGLSFQRQHPE